MITSVGCWTNVTLKYTAALLAHEPSAFDVTGRWQKRELYFLISNFQRVLYVVCFLLGNSPASEFYVPTFRNTSETSTYKIQTPGNYQEKKHTTYRTRWKFEIKNTSPLWGGNCKKTWNSVPKRRHIKSDAGELPRRKLTTEHDNSLKWRILHLYGKETTRQMEQCVLKCKHVKFRRRGITQKKIYTIQNMTKVWNQEYFTSMGRKLQDRWNSVFRNVGI
jgi:hypothetical protein